MSESLLITKKTAKESLSLLYQLCYLLEEQKVFTKLSWLEADKKLFELAKDYLKKYNLEVII